MRSNTLLLPLLLLILPFAFAIQPATQTNKIYLSPFYTDGFPANTRMNYTFTINTPDGLGTVQTAIITFHSYIIPTVTYNLTINGQACNTKTYTVSTSQAGAGSADLSFDCSNIINKPGTYTAQLSNPTKTTGATTATLDITYTNDPTGGITVHGTEYEANQPGKLWLQLLNNTGGEVNNGVCYTDIYTPAGGYLIENALMTNMHHDGIYYYDILTPEINGVYPAIVKCYYEATSIPYYAKSYTITIGTDDSGVLTDTYTTDGNFKRIKETLSGTNRRIDVTLNYTNLTSCLTVPESLLSGITIDVYAKFDSVVNDDITISIYNNTNQQWTPLPNRLLEGAAFTSATNSLTLNNLTKSGYYNTTRGIRIKLNDTNLADGANSNLDIDKAIITCDQLTNPNWKTLQGSSEMHITTNTDLYPFQVSTLCGEASESSACMQITHDQTYWNYTWGYLYDNVSIINSQQTTINEIYYYETPQGIDCTGIIDVTENQTSILNNLILSLGPKENCLVGIPLTFTPTEREHNYEITFDNYQTWEVQRARDLETFYTLVITPYCSQIATIENNPYEFPFDEIENNASAIYANNPIYLGCYRALDDLYWFEKYYNDSLQITTAGEYESYYFEIAKYYLPELYNHYQTVQALKTGGIELFQTETICEKLNEQDKPLKDDFSCQIIQPPDSYFSNQEGWTLGNVTFTNTYSASINSTFTWQSAVDTDCTAILEVIRVDENGNQEDIYSQTQQRPGPEANCKLILPVEFKANETTFDILIKAQNYVHWNMIQMTDKINAVRNNTILFCQIQLENTTYNLPINESIDAITNADNRFCIRALDDLYWFDYFEDLHETIINTPGTHYLYELLPSYFEYQYFYPYIVQNDNIIRAYQRSANQVITLSLLQNVSNSIWTSPNRTLTYYPEVTINQTNVTYNPILNLTTNTTTQEVWINTTNITYTPVLTLNLTTNTTTQEVWVNITNTTYAPELVLNLTMNTTNTSVIINATDLTPILNRLDEINTTTTNITGTVWNYPNRTLTYYPEPVINLTNTTVVVYPTDLTPVLTRLDAMNDTQTNIWNLLSGGISTTLTNILNLATNINTTTTAFNPVVSINATFNVTNTLTPDEFAYYVWNYNQQINQNIIQQLTNYDSVYAPNKNDAWSDQTR